MKAVITEKPSVARDIASVLGASEKKDGFFTGNGYCVTWALGHLVGLGTPEDYGLLSFDRTSLPILPDPFLLVVRKLKKSQGYTSDPTALKQLKVIDRVIRSCDSVIVATDAGREGELIFRYIYDFLKFKKNFERLWISSLTERSIRQGFDVLKSGKEFDGLYHSAKSRSQADWLVGINASRALSIASGGGIYSLGRVQTPTLALICRRYLEYRNFKTNPYWQIQLEHRKEFVDFKSLSKNKWSDKNQAEEALKAIQQYKAAVITSVECRTVSEQPPLLFDITGLQKEANKKLNLTAEETLHVAQSLYEKKFITYPRTGSKYIPEDVWLGVPDLIRALGDRNSCRQALTKVKWGKFNKHIVDDLKVTDHHGLLITDKIPSALSAKENAVYDMIAFRLLESISQVCFKEITEANLQVHQHDFALNGLKILDPGWRSMRGHFSDDHPEPLQDLPELKTGMEIQIRNPAALEKKTKAPALYTEATLLSAMETAGQQIQDEKRRRVLRDIGIGTPATRAAIIETLFERNYIKREKKALIPTEKGLQVFDLVKDKKIADVAMTAEWEVVLQQIENGETDPTSFQKEIESYVSSITNELLNAPINSDKPPELLCPKCRKQCLIVRDKLVKCTDETCSWVQFRNICGVLLSLQDIIQLVTHGKTNLLRGLKSKSGKSFNAFIILDEKAQSFFEFERNKSSKRYDQ